MPDHRGEAAFHIRWAAKWIKSWHVPALVALDSLRDGALEEAEHCVAISATAYGEALTHFAEHFAAPGDRADLLRAAAVAQDLGAIQHYERRLMRRTTASREALAAVVERFFGLHAVIATAMATEPAVEAEAEAYIQRIVEGGRGQGPAQLKLF